MRGRLVAAVFLVAAACSGRNAASTPEGAVELLLAAARSGDRTAVLARLAPNTRARVEALLQASRKTSGRLAMKPEDFLSVGWAPPAWEPAGTRVLRKTDQRAEVEVYSQSGDRHTVELVREGREWKIELPGR
jgi:hypothetical protein